MLNSAHARSGQLQVKWDELGQSGLQIGKPITKITICFTTLSYQNKKQTRLPTSLLKGVLFSLSGKAPFSPSFLPHSRTQEFVIF